MTGPMLAASAADAAIASAAAAMPDDAAGRWAFAIVHGDAENDRDEAAINLLRGHAEATGHLLTAYGTNDTTAFVFDAAGGRLATLAMNAVAVLHGQSWWRTHTRFGGDA